MASSSRTSTGEKPAREGGWPSLLCLFLGMGALSNPAWGAGWIPSPGSGAVRLSANRFVADVANPEGVNLGFESSSFVVEGEVGLPQRLELAARLPWVQSSNVFSGGG